MDRETARQAIRESINCRDFLEKSKGGLYCCPFCGSGHGANATGALKVYDTNSWHCFACNRSGDAIDLYRQQTGADYNAAISLLAQEIGITIDPYSPAGVNNGPAFQNTPENYTQSAKRGAGGIKPLESTKSPQNAIYAQIEGIADFTEYYKRCRERLKGSQEAQDYLKARGISYETAAAYWIGYDPEADPANAPGAVMVEKKPHPCKRLIIPTCSGHYIARRIDGVKEYAKLNPAKEKGAAAPAVFNKRVLFAPDAQAVFITEGVFDALSIIEAGAPAIAINSTANADSLLKELEQNRPAATLILCLDNDGAGKQATATLSEGLQRLNIAFICADICGGYKDPNAAFIADKEAFIKAITQAQRATAARPDNTAYYIDRLMAGEIERFKRDKKTGFARLDAKAGGLYPGLYILAAISSLGKTSFALQLADQLAAGGNDIIFFSLEQSRLELVSKSLARIMAKKDRETAATSLAIRKGAAATVQLQEAAAEYKKTVADRVSIIEGNFGCDISFIGDYIRQYIKRTGTRPVVFIDYLQILQPTEDSKRQTTKEAVDNTVTELKRISREHDITVIAISSVNRANYLIPIDFESLKESGGIEFTADAIWGLQLQCLNDPLFDKRDNIKERREAIRAAKAADPRLIELSCLKNRYGVANFSAYFEYYPANDLFIESSGLDPDFDYYKPLKTGRRL